MAKNGWKLSRVEKIGSTRPFLIKTGGNGCWSIIYGQQHSMSLLYSGAPAFRQKSTGSSRFWPLPSFIFYQQFGTKFLQIGGRLSRYDIIRTRYEYVLCDICRTSRYLKKNQNAPRPSEHPPVMGEKCQNV